MFAVAARVSRACLAVAAGVPPAGTSELQPTRLPLQKLSIQRVEDNTFHLVDEESARFLEYLVEFFGGHFSN